MASPQNPAPKSTSRWGFLSQAVASVESRLDTILADEEHPAKIPSSQPSSLKEHVLPSRASTESTRPSASSNDRLQERLAKAMAKKNSPKIESPGSSEPTSRAPTPSFLPSPAISSSVQDERTPMTPNLVEPQHALLEQQHRPSQEKQQSIQEDVAQVDPLIGQSSLQQTSKEDVQRTENGNTAKIVAEEDGAVLLQIQLEHEEARSQTENEIRGYIERIDSLNAKLQYLTKEAIETSQKTAADAEPGTVEKKLMERDEKIALLMAEGQKLSMNEMKHLTIIKKLRTEVSSNNKDQESGRLRIERAEEKASLLEEKTRKAEVNAKAMEAKIYEASQRARDLEAVHREKKALNDTLFEMKAQVAKANARAESAESKARSEQAEIEKKRVLELQNDISSAKIEREIVEGKLQREIKDLKSALDKEKDQSRMIESEMLAEQAALESKLESFRVQAEEASANDQGEAQAKLLRQIETLQRQYAAASQNWQGIEGTLLARITVLEKERDELSARESDLRRKLKDATSRAKTNGKELEDIQLELTTLQEQQSEAGSEAQQLNMKTKHLEEELGRVQKEVEDQKVRLERDYARRLEEEKSRWAASLQLARVETSATSAIRKGSSYDANHLTSPTLERPVSRRSSTLASVLNNADSYPPSRNHSAASSRHMYNGSNPETPMLVSSMDPEEYFSGISATPISPDHTPSRRGVGDLISTSTVGAGPSVQLVERMSANVRRLEIEKAASKDELARLSTQRDESRQEVVRLMREVEQKRKFERRLKELESEHKVLSERYQTTLELLGEKSEQVEELKADILDVKQMYRQLADHMKA